MPSHKAFDKQCLNTHSRPNPTVIRPSESSSFPSANAQKLFRFILPWQVSICTSLNTKLLCSMLSADLDALFCDWQNTSCCLENKLLLFRVYWVCPELSPPQYVHTQLLLMFLTFWRNWEKRIELETIGAQAAVTALKWRYFEAGCSQKEVERFPKLFWESTEWVPNRDFLSPEIYQIGQD